MPFIADTTSMKAGKDKKRKADALSEESIPESATVADNETKDNATVAESEPKKKRSKEEKRLRKEKRSKEDKSLDQETSSAEEKPSAEEKSTEEEKPTKEEKRSKKEKRSRETAEVETEQLDDANEGPGADGEDDGASPNKKRKLSVDEIEVDITAPEPPSKKALRRLKKGKPLPPSKSGADSSPEPEAKKEKKAEVEKRSGHDLTEENITRVHMPGPNDNKPANKVEKKFGKPVHNKGFAYVDFQTADHVKLAIELSEQLLTGRRLLIKDSKSFEGRPAKEEAKVDGKPPSKKIFIGNLRFDTTEETLKEHFEKCGTIEHVHVATFEDSGKCKGYAWVTFETVEAATSAVKGHVYIKEEVSDDSESESEADDSDAESGDESEKKEKPTKPKKTKMRKWWVRYKKRYGKDGTKNAGGRAEEAGAGADAGDEPVRSVPVRESKIVPKKVEYRSSYAPRLTGGIVESKGKKTTF
ncbi:hypothetical protein CJF30_00004451 [Rutstroemia sp. NJR-2017a BBW]|nr:hypothetical protein CJF30_00004451 [Rutstroemia sp. NJR-2017a BBW]